jgi:hypothetical protein
MAPKTAYFALERLINHDWRTNDAVKAGKDGSVEFRGFRGRYKLSWTDASGEVKSEIVKLS